MKIGIMGGTFDPIHDGHIKMARTACDMLSLDLVFLIPAGNPYFKNGITPYEFRYEMTRLALDELKDTRFQISDIESDESLPTYTFQTLELLRDEYPGSDLYFICGADVLHTIHTWKCPERIFELATLVVFSRELAGNETLPQQGTDHKTEQQTQNEASGLSEKEQLQLLYQEYSSFKQQFPNAKCLILDAEIPDISSTQIRELINHGSSVRGLVPDAVADYIEQKELYF